MRFNQFQLDGGLARAWGVALSIWLGMATNAHSQDTEQPRESLAGERAAEMESQELTGQDYNLRYGALRFRTEARFSMEYDDNVFHEEESRRDDIILEPLITIDALWPISDLNALKLSLGIGYRYYVDNTDLNSDAPLINPGTELEWNIYAGDFRIQLHERFYYQETLAQDFFGLEYGFQNLQGEGKFSRFVNNVGVNIDWDLNDLILSVGYDHENFISEEAEFDYLTRASDYLTASATVLVTPRIKPGAEVLGSFHDYDENVLNDNSGLRVGPFLEIDVASRYTFRAGGGYQTIQYDTTDSRVSDLHSYYVYASLDHRINRYMSHQLRVGRENSLGINADRLETIYARDYFFWRISRYVGANAYFGINFAEEVGAGFREEFDYYQFGGNLSYQFHKRWSAQLGYYLTLKESDSALADYYQNKVRLSAVYTF